ncbi:MAG: type I DNA topoisomerase [Clostridiales bacterium]|nr:type I DNA topoisomerase [Clostridiales bacterium]
MANEETSLVIVESPAKAKTIGKYLGNQYRVKASRGHLRDLPKSTIGVDIQGGFIPDYRPIPGREDTINQLVEEARNSQRVYLATDPDREGEAISWHLKELLNLPDSKALRVTFNEITKSVVTESLKNPRAIDMDLVDAQQARRILDRIVGYKLSPLLWTKIRKGLSAGRVQSVATRMVVDRENQIREFIPEEYWLLDAILKCEDEKGFFTARFYGTTDSKLELGSLEDVEMIIKAVSDSPFTITGVKRTDKPRSPSAPFITSTLQQEASRKLNMTPRRTMSIAQQLYEGIEISGKGSVGLITYMRTDSLRVSAEAQDAARNLIVSTYGNTYCPLQPRIYKTRSGAQDAHEAIRPSDVTLKPDDIKSDLTNEQYRLYKLIWSRFIASQMSNAVYDTINIEVSSAGYIFKTTHSTMKFPGFSVLYDNSRDDEPEDKESLPVLYEGESVSLKELKKEQKFTKPPSRYTEDTLIRAMEEKGIGRPSTYAPTMSTIIDREYVVKEGKSLKPTALGEAVTALITERFHDIVDLKFTARMEDSLDEIEDGKREWKSVLSEFYTDFDRALKDAENALQGVRIKVPDEETDEICEKCGKKMVIKSGRFGKFLACPGYPSCNNTKPLVIEMPGKCPKCSGRILKRMSKKGYVYYACERGMDCGFMTWDVPVKENCPECGLTMFKKSGRGYNKPFCTNEVCVNFLPEDKRGYKRKTNSSISEESDKTVSVHPSEDKKTAKKSGTASKHSATGKTSPKRTDG